MQQGELPKVIKPIIYMVDWETAEKLAPKEYLKTLGKEINGATVLDFATLQIQNNYVELIGFLQSISLSGYRYVHLYEDKSKEESLKTKEDEPVL